MTGAVVSDSDVEDLGKRIAAAAAAAASLDDLEAWLRAQPGVRDVRRSSAILKSNPPQQDFVLDLAQGEGAAVRTVVVSIFLHGNRTFELSAVRDR